MTLKEQIIDMYHGGLGGVTIARKLNLHPQTVYYHLRDVKKPNGGRQAKSDVNEIQILYESGLSCGQIAEKLGLSDSGVVWQRLKNNNVKIRSKREGMQLRGMVKIGPDDEVIKLYKSGLSQVDIAKKYNMCISGVTRVLNKYQLNEGTKGKRNPSWKGGITTIANTIRSSSQYIDFRDKHFLNNAYMSELSGIKPNNVNMHHIVEFSFILNNFTDHTNWQKCKHLWQQNNVIVISEDEHRQIHSGEKIDINFSKLSIRLVTKNECVLLLSANHYIGTIPRNSRLIYGLYINDSLLGCCIFGTGANRFLSSGVGGKALELTRLCLVDWLPRNTASFFLSKVIKQLKKDATDIEFLVSFADPNVGHDGTVYKACNWQYTGQCKKDYQYRLKDATVVHKSKFRCKNGKTEKELVLEAGAIKIPIQGKHRYVYKLR